VPTTLFTIGYERRNAEAMLAELKSLDVDVVLDVRELPLSRRRGFSKTSLGRALEAGGIRYEHDRRLGNPQPYRDLYRAGEAKAGAAAFRAHLQNGSSAAVLELAERLRSESVCLLCVEDDAEQCHRAVIVETLRERLPRLVVRHL
jgi:uncharacterized protein (DUF488 family)